MEKHVMEAKNFRIGNLVKYEDRVFRIHSLSEELPTLDTPEFGIGVVGWNDIKPIELTSELIKDLGFVDTEYKKGFTGIEIKIGNGMYIYFILNKPYSIGEHQTYYVYESVPIKYIHELQNLFFAITKRELLFKN